MFTLSKTSKKHAKKPGPQNTPCSKHANSDSRKNFQANFKLNIDSKQTSAFFPLSLLVNFDHFDSNVVQHLDDVSLVPSVSRNHNAAIQKGVHRRHQVSRLVSCVARFPERLKPMNIRIENLDVEQKLVSEFDAL